MTPHLVTEAQLRATGQPKKKARRCGNSDGQKPTRKDTLTVSTDKHTEAPPLDPHTLRVVIERLGERITHAETERENDASEGLPADEMADWDTRIEALELARWDIENIAKTANPRARVVVLPEPDWVDEDDEPYWPGDEFQSVTVELSVENKHYIYFPGSCQTVDQARIIAGSILAAAEFAGGAQ